MYNLKDLEVAKFYEVPVFIITGNQSCIGSDYRLETSRLEQLTFATW
jgi:hypothetical protein